MNLPTQFRHTIITAFGEAGESWLERLPNLINYCQNRWSLDIGRHFDDLSYNYVAPAVRDDGTEIVLKLGVPRDELLTETAALRCYDGRGSVRLIEAEPERGILLLQRLKPGTMLFAKWPNLDDEATEIAAGIMRRLWRPVPEKHDFVTVQDWFKGYARLRRVFEGSSGPFPAFLVDLAESLYSELLDSMAEPVLLHGDLHHFNILSTSGMGWLAIDPKGVVGEAAYDTGALLRNPVPDIYDYPQILDRRITILAEELDLDRQRIVGWGIAQAVLSGWWSYEDHGSGWEPSMALAEMMMSQLK